MKKIILILLALGVYTYIMSENKSDLFLSAAKHIYHYCYTYVKDKNFEVDVNHWSSSQDTQIENDRPSPQKRAYKKRHRW